MWRKIEAPHYYAGHRAMWGPWIKLKPHRMCYKAGYKQYRAGITDHRKLTCEFRS